MSNKNKRAFLICPVRGVESSVYEDVVSRLEKEGWNVHFPHRDTDQDDDIGYRICSDNRYAIELSDAVFVIRDGKNQGCLFDLGMAFSARKPIVVVDVPEATPRKSFQNMMVEWEQKGPDGK